ncbi:hypothetical protein ACG7TL_003293 [Trametes sanguinea]
MSDEIDKTAMMADASHLGRCGWNDWKKRVMALCELKGALGHLNGTALRPSYADVNEAGTPLPLTDEQRTTMDKWDEKERYVRFMLKYNTTSEASAGITLEGMAANIWAQFLARYDATTSLDRINLVRKLEAMKLVPGSDIDAHVAAMCQAWQLALNAGANVPASNFTVYLCNSLPASMEPLVAHLLDNERPEYVMKQIRAIYTNSLMRAGITATLTNTVTATGAFANPPNNAFVARSTIVCDWCGWNAHSRDRCYCPGGGMAGQQPSTWKTEPRPKKGSPCDVMMREALATIKPTSNPSNVSHTANLTATQSISSTMSNSLPDTSTLGSHATTATHAFVAALATEALEIKVTYDAKQEPMSNVRAYADTGASHHYFTDRRHFSNYRPTSSMTGNAAKRGSTFKTAGIGDIVLVLRAEGRDVQIMLRDIGGGYRVEIKEGCLRVYDQNAGSLCLVGLRTEADLYQIDIVRVIPDEEDYPPRAFATTAKADLATWHRRLGHPREQTIRDMVRTSAVKGIELTGKPPIGRCTDCLQGKHPRAPFYPATVETAVGERVYIDVMFFNTASLGGGEIAYTFDDGGSSFLVAYVTRTKTESESVGLLETYHTWLERQSGNKLLVVRTDNGGEFINSAWSAYLRHTGIHHETTTPKTPQQNGVAERGHCTLGERVRTMLADSRLPKYLWDEALMCATYTKNLTASMRQGGKTPYERFYRTVPDISHLRAFGCLAWVKVPDYTRKKLDPKSVRGFLVGYTEDASYRVWLPQEGGPRGKVVRSRDVVFEEGPPHRTLTAEGELDYGGFVLPGNDHSKKPTLVVETHEGKVEATSEEASSDGEADPCLGDFQAVAEPEPELPRCSSREAKPSRALLETREYETRENEAKEKGEVWAGLTRSGIEAKYVAWLAELGDVSSEVPEGLEGGRTPMSFKEAEREPDIWRPAMKKEIEGLEKIQAWRLVPRTSEMNVVGCKWAFARKFDAAGQWKPKARLVAKGFHQILGVDYFESHASVVRFESLRIICATATYRDMEMRQDDIEKAYLNATPQKTVYMDQPPGFVDQEHPDYVCEVLRSLYGLMHAGNDWWQHLDSTYDQLGFSRSRADECVRARFDNSGLSITATYTDDITSASDDTEALKNIQRDLSARYKLSSGELYRSAPGKAAIYELPAYLDVALKGLDVAALSVRHVCCTYAARATPILNIMSNSLQQLVPVLDGSNYARWAELMKAYLQQQEVWYIVELPAGITAPTLQEDGSNRNEVIGWTMTQSKAMGSIRLRLNDEVAKLVKDATTAKKLWDDLKDLYGTTSALGAYSYYKAAVGTRIPPNEHPGPAIAKIQGNLDQLEGAGINIPANLRALMTLDAAPSRYETAIQLCLNDNDLSELTTSAAREALVASWEATTTRGNRNKAGEAKKLSAIKRKGKDPSFKQQQQQQRHQNGDGGSQQQQQKKGKARRGKRKSQKSSDHDHAHLVSPATISDGPTSTVDPRALLRKPVQVNGPEGESKYPTLKRAFNLARELDVTPSIERIRALEGVIKAADKGEGTSRIVEVPSDSDSADSHSSKRTRLTLAERIDWTERDDDAESAISLGNEDEDVDMEIAQAAGLYEQYDEQVRSDL